MNSIESCFSKTIKLKEKAGGIIFAKEYQKPAKVDNGELNRLFQQIDCKFLVKPLIKEIDKRTLFIVNEYPLGSLDKYLLTRNISDFQKFDIAITIAKSIVYLHSKGLFCGNIKPQNILIGDDESPRISDFYHYYLFRETSDLVEGTYGCRGLFTATEIAKAEMFDHRADVYSYGIILFLIFGGNLPVINQFTHSFLDGLNDNLQLPEEKYSKVNEIIKSCCRSKYQDRILSNAIVPLLLNSSTILSIQDQNRLKKYSQEKEYADLSPQYEYIAAIGGIPESMYSFSKKCYNKREFKKGEPFLLKAARANYPIALLKISSFYMKGKFYQVNEEAAFQYTLKARLKGCDKADYQYCFYKMNGIGCEKCIIEANKILDELVARKYPKAMNLKAEIIEAKEKDRAFNLFNQAAEKYYKAKYNYARMLLNKVIKDKVLIKNMLDESSIKSGDALNLIGELHEKGIIYEKSKEMAVLKYSEAVAKHCTKAYYNLGRTTYDHNNPKNSQGALEMIKLAADMNCNEAKDLYNQLIMGRSIQI